MKVYVLCESRAGITKHIREVRENAPPRLEHVGQHEWPPALCGKTAVRDIAIRRSFDPTKATCAHCIAAHHKETWKEPARA